MPPLPRKLFSLRGEFGIVRLEPSSSLPDWIPLQGFYSVTRTGNELSLVVPVESIPAGLLGGPRWRALGFAGQLDFSLTGVVAGISAILAAHAISVFVISTYETDYVLVPVDYFEQAATVLVGAGYERVDDWE